MLDKILEFLGSLKSKTYSDPETGYKSKNIKNSMVRIKKNGVTTEYKYDSEGNVTRKKY